jgi:hypothetical protein
VVGTSLHSGPAGQPGQEQGNVRADNQGMIGERTGPQRVTNVELFFDLV